MAEVCALDVERYGHDRGHRLLRFTAKGRPARGERSSPPRSVGSVVAPCSDRVTGGPSREIGAWYRIGMTLDHHDEDENNTLLYLSRVP